MVAGLKSPGLASSLRWATSCHVRAKMRSTSASSTSWSRYISLGSVEARASSSSSFMRQHCGAVAASLAIVNGSVWSRPGETAISIEGERIIGIHAGRVDAERIIDAAGATILPAFNDAHVHFLMGSRGLTELDLFGLNDLSSIHRQIADFLMRDHRRPWVVGRGWLYSAFPGGMPTVEQLDRFIPDRPAYIESFDAHTAWVNSAALAIAGVSTAGVL